MPPHWAHNFKVDEREDYGQTQITIAERDEKEGPVAIISYSTNPESIFQIDIFRPESEIEHGIAEQISIINYENYDQAIHDAKIIIYAMWKDQLEYEELCEKYGTGSVSPLL